MQYPTNFTKYLSLQKNEVGDLDVVQQLEEGQSLQDLLKQFKKLKNSIRDLTYKMAKCIQIMHNNGVIHGNLKLSNFIVVETGHIKVTDINFWPARGLNIQQKLVCEFSAPELFRRKNLIHLTEKCDIWSLAIIILCLYLGFCPWTDQNKQLIALSNIRRLIKMQRIFKIPDSIQGDFRDLLEKMLERDPVKRIDINQVIEHDYLTCNSNSLQETRKTEDLQNEIDQQEIYQKLQFSSFSGNSEFSQSSSHMRLNRHSSYSQYSQEKSPIMIPGIITGKVSPFGAASLKNSCAGFKQTLDSLERENTADIINKFSLNDDKIQGSPLRRPSTNQRKSDKMGIFPGNQSENSSSDVLNSEYIVQEFASSHNNRLMQDSDLLQSQMSDFRAEKMDNPRKADQYRKEIEKLIEQELQFYDDDQENQGIQHDSSLYTNSYKNDSRLDMVDNSQSSYDEDEGRNLEDIPDNQKDYVLSNLDFKQKNDNIISELDNYSSIEFNKFAFYVEEKSPSDKDSQESQDNI